jgi:type IV secretory pathway protease TraF
MGDNRPDSRDSRYFGPVNAHDIVGKLVVRVLPLNSFQRF